MMSSTLKKRLSALLVGTVMTMTAVSASMSGAFSTVWAAGKTVTVNKELAIPIKDGNTVTNLDDVTYKTTDIKSFATSGLTSLQFNFTASEPVYQFQYYFGISMDAVPWWWDTKSISTTGSVTCTPYASKFSVVVDLSSVDIGYDDTYGEKHFEIQNCYTEADGGKPIPIKLESVVVNGTTDTSFGTPIEKENANTGGPGYATKNAKSGSGSEGFKDNGDGTATIISTFSKHIPNINLELTAGYDLDSYIDDDGRPLEESTIRENGDPLNSHEMKYSEFGIRIGEADAHDIQIESISATIKSDKPLKRFMYGAGLSVVNGSPADVESAKVKAGLKEQGGYWYNDMGPQEVEKYKDVPFEITPTQGVDIRDEESLGTYFQVTWDVPAAVRQHTTVDPSSKISFQYWYGVEDAEQYTECESVTLVDAVVTYTQSTTFPYQANKTKNVNKTIKTNENAEVLFSDFGIDYDYTCDVYAILFNISSTTDISKLVVGLGTSVRNSCPKKTSDYWYQATADSLIVTEDPTTHTYTLMWIIPGDVAESLQHDPNKHMNYISTEQPGDNFKLGFWYGGAGETEASSVTLKDVTIYYTTDDRDNIAKLDIFEGPLVVPEVIELEVGESKQIECSVDTATFRSDNMKIATVFTDGTVKGIAEGETDVQVTTPGGQAATVHVIVKSAATTTTTAPVTTPVTTTTKPIVPLYGDVNLDNDVSLADTVIFNKYLLEAVTFNAQQMANGDCYYDGEVDEKDCSLLILYLLRVEGTKLGPESTGSN